MQRLDDRVPAAGVCSAGLKTTVLPVPSAAAIIPVGIASGKFHGAITAHDARGKYRSVLRSPGSWISGRPLIQREHSGA